MVGHKRPRAPQGRGPLTELSCCSSSNNERPSPRTTSSPVATLSPSRQGTSTHDLRQEHSPTPRWTTSCSNGSPSSNSSRSPALDGFTPTQSSGIERRFNWGLMVAFVAVESGTSQNGLRGDGGKPNTRGCADRATEQMPVHVPIRSRFGSQLVPSATPSIPAVLTGEQTGSPLEPRFETVH